MDCLRRRKARSFPSNTKKAAAARGYRNGEARLRTQLTLFGQKSNPIMIFTLSEILIMTNNFSDTNRIVGSIASLYKGTLGGRLVVVKKPNSDLCLDTQERLMNSIVVLSNMNHNNIVKLIGCCLETQLPIPVYNFAFNVTLFDRMRCPENMSWKNRLRIAAEIADGLNYMHSGAPVPIIHRDIHPQHVILDKSDTAKIIDLGLSVPVPLGETHVEDDIVVGNWGYGDPECLLTRKVTEKSDVYSFGVTLLHLLTCKQARFPSFDCKNKKITKELVGWFLSKMEDGHLFEVIDFRIRGKGSLEQFQAFAEIALRCTRAKGVERPTMKDVVLELRRIKKL
ncbi:Wall-associated receptor kinase-like 1 [Acorus gramineus]|uniref:Wall-associated receptor kinase-like 1 n=1 Tax=Acorus gramineus TaxID=55184 RepID=A0AAV9A733_ACOGR|nr:Wall-associated receptor kinase-like 1 [Acorus gramineus]